MLILIPIGWLLAVGVGLTLDPSLIGWSLLYSLPSLLMPVVAHVSTRNAALSITSTQHTRIKINDKSVMFETEIVYFLAWWCVNVASILIAAACPLGVLWRLGGAS